MPKGGAADPFKGRTSDDFKSWLKTKEVKVATIAVLGTKGFNTFRKLAASDPSDFDELPIDLAQKRLLKDLAKEAQEMKKGRMTCPRKPKKTKGKRPGPQGKKDTKEIPVTSTSGGDETGSKMAVEEDADNEARRDSPAGERTRRSLLEEELARYDEKRSKQSKGAKGEPDPAAYVNFGLNQDHAWDVGPLIQVIPKVPASVGMIMQGQRHVGTGFRVTPQHIMTCLHVVRKDLFPSVGGWPLIQGEQSPSSAPAGFHVAQQSGGATGPRELKNMQIKFCHTSADYTKESSHKLTQLKYSDLELDVAIIEIDGADRLASSSPLQLCRTPQDGPLYLFGHPGFGRDATQKMDHKIEVVRRDDFTKEVIDIVDKYYDDLLQKCNSEKNVHKLYDNPGFFFQPPNTVSFEGMLDNNFQIIHTSFLPGASGSPGVQVDAAGRVTVRLMLCRGFPAFYHKLTDAGRNLHPMPDQKYRFEHGLDLTKLHAKMQQCARDNSDRSFIRQIFG